MIMKQNASVSTGPAKVTESFTKLNESPIMTHSPPLDRRRRITGIDGRVRFSWRHWGWQRRHFTRSPPRERTCRRLQSLGPLAVSPLETQHKATRRVSGRSRLASRILAGYNEDHQVSFYRTVGFRRAAAALCRIFQVCSQCSTAGQLAAPIPR